MNFLKSIHECKRSLWISLLRNIEVQRSRSSFIQEEVTGGLGKGLGFKIYLGW